jgi:peptidoglycan/LPS O-acetylase OafA/YrhL
LRPAETTIVYPALAEHAHVTPVPPSSGVRLAGIEGLRAIAACSVVLLHVWTFSMPHGEVLWDGRRIADAFSTLQAGVILFFALSGFLLYRPFAASIARGQPLIPVSSYLRNRALRILPAYWVILAIAVALGAVHVRDESGQLLNTGWLTDPLALLQTALLSHDYRPSTLAIGIGPAWSLAVEIVFYAVLPLLVLGAARAARTAKSQRGRVLVLLGPPLMLLLLGLSGKYAAAQLVSGGPLDGWGNDWHSVIERSFWAQADLFSFGMVVAVLHTEVADGRITLPSYWRRLAVGLGLLVFVPCAWTMHRAELSYVLQNTGVALAIGLFLAVIVIPDSRSGCLRSVRLLETRVPIAVGVISYSVFLWHVPVILWLQTHGVTLGGGAPALLVNLFVTAAVVGALSALTYRYVERPALLRKRRTNRATAEQPPAVITSASAEASMAPSA